MLSSRSCRASESLYKLKLQGAPFGGSVQATAHYLMKLPVAEAEEHINYIRVSGFLYKLKNTGSITWWISATNSPTFAEGNSVGHWILSGRSWRVSELL